ncbi:hypothetical protein L2E82_45263 [Cichorium intybus]|uniref:Uncharacterized protein n=1 Tax=Cichorium intybus TaxID=13427 RepID=A0ACB8ZRJ0_CICIN|nr:hypothetical protein L2E82_45263 [Cichorium intybus]
MPKEGFLKINSSFNYKNKDKSIAALDEALASIPPKSGNPRARLLQEVDFLQKKKDGDKGVNQDPLDSKDIKVKPLKETEDVKQYSLDSKEAEVKPMKEYSIGVKKVTFA